MLAQKIKGISGWIIIALLSLSPILIWMDMLPIAGRFTNPAATLTSIGQMMGLVGMAMFALTFVLSTRHRILEQFFNGMNQVYVAHHTFGAIAFSLLLFHPLLLAIKYVIVASTRDAALFLLSTDPNILWGTGALLSMMLFLVLTFFVSFAYDKWKLTHKFLSISFILASIHTLVIYSDTQISMGLHWYMTSFIVLGAIPILYRTVAPQLFVSYVEYIVDEVRQLDEKTIEIFMNPVFKPMAYKAGQFIFINLENDPIGKESHPFSIVSAPSESRLTIGVKFLGDHTSKFRLIQKGMVAKIEGPFGSFSYDSVPGKDQIWIAGGIGATPFISMAKSVTDPSYHIKIYYCVSDQAEAVFLEDLMAVQHVNPNVQTMPFCSNERGYISADAIEHMNQNMTSKEFFICGPPSLMKGLKHQLLEKGIDSSRIHTEEFTFR